MTRKAFEAHFEISPAVVFRLGDELITDAMQALVELVKNAYDADATWAKVRITTPKPSTASEPATPGEIIVEDNGHGMDDETLRTGWLMIADSGKKAFKDDRRTTARARTPLGDKGLGRLGVQRLGREVEIVTRTADPDAREWQLAFSWREFKGAKMLSQVPVTLVAQDRSRPTQGTRITVRDLVDADLWKGEGNRNRLQRSLAELISPYGEVRDFLVDVTLDGSPVPIAQVADQVRRAASVRYRLRFDGATFRVDGSVKLDFLLRTEGKVEGMTKLQRLAAIESWRGLILNGGEPGFYEYVCSGRKRLSNPRFRGTREEFLVFAHEIALEDLGGVALVDGKPANPGPFHGEVDYVLLDAYDKEDSVWDSAAEFRNSVKELAGIRVYRNGFGIRSDKDWLDLGNQATSGGSLYGLRLKNTLGYIAISARDNSLLLETTNREGFQKTPHFLNFYGLLRKFIAWSSDSQELLRRRSNDHFKDFVDRAKGLDPENPVGSGATELVRLAASIDTGARQMREVRQSVKEAAAKAQRVARDAVASSPQASFFEKERAAEREVLGELVAILDDPRITDVPDKPAALMEAKSIVQTLEEREERLRQELEMFHEAMALGLTAEALSHEIATIADGLAERASGLATYLARHKPRDSKVWTFVEHVRSSVGALRKQLGHLQPSLRYVREKREVIQLGTMLAQIAEFYAGRFEKHDITLEVAIEADFRVLMNRGKLAQVFDNLLLNAEFWLRETSRREPGRHGRILLKVARPWVVVSDDGPGVPLSVEESLFQPFVTTKDRGLGRGLGLYIVQQLLDVEGCQARLRPERNAAGRRYQFEVNLAGALHD